MADVALLGQRVVGGDVEAVDDAVHAAGVQPHPRVVYHQVRVSVFGGASAVGDRVLGQGFLLVNVVVLPQIPDFYVAVAFTARDERQVVLEHEPGDADGSVRVDARPLPVRAGSLGSEAGVAAHEAVVGLEDDGRLAVGPDVPDQDVAVPAPRGEHRRLGGSEGSGFD